MYDVLRERVSATRVRQSPVRCAETSIRYPVIGPAVPGKDGCQFSSIVDAPVVFAVSAVGAFGNWPSVEALATFEGAPVPKELIAETR